MFGKRLNHLKMFLIFTGIKQCNNIDFLHCNYIDTHSHVGHGIDVLFILMVTVTSHKGIISIVYLPINTECVPDVLTFT